MIRTTPASFALLLCLLVALLAGPAWPRPQDPPPVAELRLRGAQEGWGLVRACLPLPPGYRFDRGACPFTIAQAGVDRPTQWELVTRYPDGDAAVVELLARVGLRAPGDHVFTVHERPPPAVRQNLRDAWGAHLQSLLLTSVGLTLRAFDGLGNEYRGQISLGGPRGIPSRMHRKGPVATTYELAGWLEPVQAGGTALPRLLGYVASVTVEPGSDLVGLELLVHAGPTTAPFPAKVYFRGLELLSPSGWSVAHLWPEPSAGPEVAIGSRVFHPIVAPLPQPDPATAAPLHVMLPRGRREWRMVLHRGEPERARACLDSGRGFATPIPGRGWSWASSEAAGWGPEGVALPDLLAAPWGFTPSAVDNSSHNRGAIWAGFAARSKILPGWDAGGAQGPYHPAGTHYGGTTGGMLIWQYEAQLAVSGSPAMLAATKAWHRAITDRHRVALYELDGRPVELDAHPAGWSIFSGRFQKNGEGPFRYAAADRTQEDWVASNGLAPTYEAQLALYDPIDGEHLARRLSHAIALSWTDNDPLARREVFLAAELARGYYWDGPLGNQTGMLAAARARPERGSGGIGRAYGWALQAGAAAWAMGDDQHRGRWARWAEQAAELLTTAQMENGHLQAVTSGKLWTYGGGSAAMMQAIEQGIAVNGAASWARVTGDPRFAQVVGRASLGLVRFAWRPGASGPYSYLGVRPMDPTQPVYLTLAEVPTAALGDRSDAFMIGSTLAFGLALYEGKPEHAELLEGVRKYAGAGAVDQIVPRLAGRGLEQFPDSRAPLLGILAGAKWGAR